MNIEKDNYKNENIEMNWELDSIPIYGTLVKPIGVGPFPGVVMVAGSGPTDRDWNSPLLPGTNGSAHLIAESLGKSGLASLRYDKRVTGPHARENMQTLIGKLSMQSHMDELSGAVDTIAKQDFIRKNQLFAMANSEGTLHALNYQIHNPKLPFAGLVLIAPPGRAVGAVARSQIAEQATHIPNGDTYMELYDTSIARFLDEKPMNIDASLPQGVQDVLKALEAPANLPFSRELWNADAASLLKKVDIPTLVIIGKKDFQVDWEIDGEPLEHAASGLKNVTFLYPENANHVLKYEPKPRSELTMGEVLKNYNAPEARLDEQTMAKIAEWMIASQSQIQ